MSNIIYPCFWFDNQASEAADFYCKIFKNASVLSSNAMVSKVEIEGLQIMALNGGPMFKINQSISLFVTCETEGEIMEMYEALLEGGSTMMAMGTYPWAEKYAWLADKYGVTWQLMLGQLPEDAQKIIPCFLFVGAQYGKAQEAIHSWASIFSEAEIFDLQMYMEGEGPAEGNLKFGHFSLFDQEFAAMDGPGDHDFQFNEGVSFVVECDDQEELDEYWELLTEEGEEGQCGWLKDQFGVSWQIVPSVLASLMSDPVKSPKVVEAFMKMKKFDIATLMEASK